MLLVDKYVQGLGLLHGKKSSQDTFLIKQRGFMTSSEFLFLLFLFFFWGILPCVPDDMIDCLIRA